MDAGAGECATAFAHRLDIAAGGKCRPGAGQDGAPNIAVGIDLLASLRKQLSIAFFAKRIAALGPVDRESDYRAVFLTRRADMDFLLNCLNHRLPRKPL